MQGPDYPTETILHYTTVPLKLGFGAADEVGYEAKRLGAERVLICTDKNLRATGHPDRIRRSMTMSTRNPQINPLRRWPMT
jgi:alcohol dehydrogenase class IV